MSADDRRVSRPAETREKLIDAAASLIPELGWDNVSSRRVADRAGVNLGVVHYHVNSIAELRRIAAIRRIRAFFEGPAREALLETDPRTAIGNLLNSLSASGPRDPELLLLFESLVAAGRDDRLRKEIAGSLAELRTRLLEWLTEQGAAAPAAAAVTITAAIDGYLLQRALDPSLEPDLLIEALASLVRPPT
ncbi:TetR/AcrR family transcriptional regulator [Streptomyces sp. NPDC014622]|uniref:TetR/AcrR family transcriptional regulator n=1 Tax=Streptomyces sp. NPDC014622 TaxID=3364874 RepID=UPI0036FC46AC